MSNNHFTLGFSPCPNDCFIFDAMVNGKIDTEGLSFDVTMSDVEELNKFAFEGKLDVTKLSYHAYAWLTKNYVLLNSGSALGYKCGPLLISKNTLNFSEVEQKSNELKIAIPGKYTTANFLLSLAFPKSANKVEMRFSDIENAVLNRDVDAGLIIHENRFTYEQKGLKKIVDLGEYWEQETSSPIPLGGIVAKRDISTKTLEKLNRVLRRSIEYAFENPKSSLPFVREHAQEMDENVMYKHIDLYVNKFSIDLGEEGKNAVKQLFEKAIEKQIIPSVEIDNIFG